MTIKKIGKQAGRIVAGLTLIAGLFWSAFHAPVSAGKAAADGRIVSMSEKKQLLRLTRGETVRIQWKGANGKKAAWRLDSDSFCKLSAKQGKTVRLRAVKPGKTVVMAKVRENKGKKITVKTRKLTVLVEDTVQEMDVPEVIKEAEAKLKAEGFLLLAEETARKSRDTVKNTQASPKVDTSYFSAVQKWDAKEAAEWIARLPEEEAGRFVYLNYDGIRQKESLRLYEEDTDKKHRFLLYSYSEPTRLSFEEAYFYQGETEGEISVRNKVPGSAYIWESSHPEVVGILREGDTDTSVRLWAKEPGESLITCYLTYPQGEPAVLTAKIVVESRDTEEAYSVGEAMRQARLILEREGCVPIRNDMLPAERSLYGYDANCIGRSVLTPWLEEKEKTAEWLAKQQIYTYYEIQYQGRVGSCRKFGIYGSGESWESGVKPD